jgi:hypothetical protein
MLNKQLWHHPGSTLLRLCHGVAAYGHGVEKHCPRLSGQSKRPSG